MNLLFRRLGPADAAAYRELRLKGLRESSTAFGSSFEEESGMPINFFEKRLDRTDDKWVFGAFRGSRLIGTVALLRDAQLKLRHKAGIYGVYVTRRARRLGIGRALLAIAIDTAGRLPGLKQVRLSVETSNLPALKLYASCGFVEYGRERDALFVDGRFYSELLLVLKLKRKPPNKAPEPTSTAVTPRANGKGFGTKRQNPIRNVARGEPAAAVAHL